MTVHFRLNPSFYLHIKFNMQFEVSHGTIGYFYESLLSHHTPSLAFHLHFKFNMQFEVSHGTTGISM